MKKILAYGLVGGLLLLPFSALAINPPAPHDSASGVACNSCHTTHRDVASMSGSDYYNNVCLSCHRPGDAKGGTKPLALADAANPTRFKGYTAATPKPEYQTSHRWDGFLSSTSAGAQAPLTPELVAKLAATNNTLACIVCHNQHDNTNGKFLRGANDTDQLCRDCHRDRDQNSHVGGNHPVLVGYTTTARNFPAVYRQTPLNANPANTTAAVQIKNGLVACSSCHGLHYSDSRSSTEDSGANFANLSSGDGNLLRTDRRGTGINATTGDALNICSNCHANKFTHNGKNQNIQCTDCHGAHVADPRDPAAANLFLVKRDLGAQKVYFNTAAPNFNFASNDPQKPGVCQACHEIPTGVGYPDEHTTQTGCLGCHSHSTPLASGGSFGLKGGCTACHGYPPEANTAGGPNGYAVYLGTTPSPFTAENTGGHIAHADKQQYAKRCAECHKGNTHNSGTFADVFITPGPLLATFTSAANGGLKPVYNSAAADMTCNNVYCHSNGAPRGGTLVPVATPSWSQGNGGGLGSITQQANRCDFCHQGYKGTLVSNGHPKHLATAAICTNCHQLSPADNGFVPYSGNRHVNGQKDVIFSGSAASGAWDTTNATCANLYCHSNGQAPPVYVTTPAWGSGNTTCTSCHGDRNSTSGQLSARHYAHLNYTSNVGRPLHCTSCHAATAGSDSAIANPLNHASGKVNIRFDERLNPSSSNPTYGGTSATSADGAAISTSAAGGTCTNTYCHSGGTVGNANSPAWGNGLSIGCDGCHGNGTGKAHPVYTGTNSHIQHVENAGYGCDYCHVNTVANNSVPPTKVRYQPFSTHINRRIDVVFKLNGGATGSFNPATHSCAATYCHGSNSPTWGATGTLNCAGCHGANNALPGAHGIHYATATLPTKFRNLSGNVSSANVYRFSCSTCHDPATATHAGGPAQPTAPVGAAEVAFAPLAVKTGTVAYNYGASQGVPDDQNLKWTNGGATSCNTTYCHSNGRGGNGVAIDWATTTSSGSCNKCHADAAAAGSLSGRHANHLASTTLAAVTFTCAVCHGNTAANNATISNKAKHVNQVKDVAFGPYSGSYNLGTSACLNTYCHSNGTTTRTPQHPALSWNTGTIPANCAGCHGNAISSGGAGSALSGKHRAHLNNYTTLGLGNNFGCNDCHVKTAANNTTISDRTRHINQLRDYSGARAGRIIAAGECASNYCHSSGQATPVYRNMTGAKRWTGTATFNCGGCHGPGSTLGAPNYPNGGAGATTANSHAKHVMAIGVIDSTQCADCHAKTVDPVIAGKFKDYTGGIYHLNRQRDVVFQPVGIDTGNYDQINRTCAATYCHGTPATLPQWGGPSLACNSCHKADRNKAGSHYIHYDSALLPEKFINLSGNVSTAANYRFTCSSCHAAGPGKAQHARGPANANGVAQIFFSFTTATTQPYDYGTNQGFDNGTFGWTNGGTASCNTSYCHSNGQGGTGANINWGQTLSGFSCDKCHATAGLSAKHARHIGAADYGFGCVTCHGATVSDNSTISDKSRHVNRTKDVAINATYGGTYTGGNCTSTYCHSDGKVTPSYVNQAWSGVTTCVSCHGNAVSSGAAATPLSGAHASHVNNAAIIGTNFGCADCHALTVSNNTTISDKTVHVNRSRNVSFAASYGGSGACATYCHTNGLGGAPNVAVVWTGAAINCNGCHNSIMTSGSHTQHISNITHCAKCHRLTTTNGAEILAGATMHLNKAVDLRFNTFAGFTGSFRTDKTCANTYCHGSTSSSPVWGVGATTCHSCHGTIGTAALPGGHAIHAGVTEPASFNSVAANNSSGGAYNFTCSSCHLGGTGKAQHAMGPANGFGDAQVFFGLTTNTRKGSYTAGSTTNTDGMGFKWTSDGTGCATGYCHSDGKGGNGSAAISWTTTVPSGASCEKCHTTPALSGRHAVHISATDYNFACAICHSATISSGSTAISDKSKHVNKVKDVAISSFYGGTFNGSSCQTVYCHSNASPFGGTNVFRTPVWTSTVGCTGCHAQGSGAPGDTNLSFTHNKHIGLTTYAFTCDRCHVQSVNPSNGIIPGGLHVNKVKDVRFGHFTGATSFGNISGAYNLGARTCATVYCHSNGITPLSTATAFATPVWGGAATSCTSCHGYSITVGGAGTVLSRRHANHAKSGSYNYNCSRCHIATSSNGTTITGIGQHVNGLRDVSFAVYSTATESILRGTWEGTACKNVYCHGDGQHNNYDDASKNQDWASPTVNPVGCNYCHLNTPNSGSHTTHRLAGSDCDTCHLQTVSNGFANLNKAVHADQRVTIQFSNQVNGTYNGIAAGGANVSTKLVTATPTPSTCGNTSCHGTVSPVWGQASSSCISCHASIQTGTHGTPRDAVTGEFGLAWGHKKSGRATVSDADCIVCHLEGDFTTQIRSAKHGDGNIDLRDPDGAGETPITNISGTAFTFTKFATSYAAGSRTSTGHLSNSDIANVISQKFCLACHDGNGATNTTARSNNGGTGTAAMPFGGIALGATYTAANSAIGTQGLIDVKTQTATTNASAHPIQGPRNNAYGTPARFNAPYNNFARNAGTKSNGVVINCFDCHNTPTPLTNRTIVAHGNAVTLRGNVWANPATLCQACHIANVGSQSNGQHGTGSAFASDTDNGMQSFINARCEYCHSSSTASPGRPIRAQDVHGFDRFAGSGTDTTWPKGATDTYKPFAFMRNTVNWGGASSWRPASAPGLAAGTATCGGSALNSAGCTGNSMTSYTPGGTY